MSWRRRAWQCGAEFGHACRYVPSSPGNHRCQIGDAGSFQERSVQMEYHEWEAYVQNLTWHIATLPEAELLSAVPTLEVSMAASMTS